MNVLTAFEEYYSGLKKSEFLEWEKQLYLFHDSIYNSTALEIKTAIEYDFKSGILIPPEIIMFAYDRWMFLTDFSKESVQAKIDYLMIYLDDYEEEIAKLRKLLSFL